MVDILNITEEEYRGVNLPSYSLLKALDDSGPKVLNFKKKIFGEVVDFGNLVDCLLLQPEELDNKFYFKPIKIPTPQLQKLADYIVENYSENPAENDILELSKELNLFGKQLDETRIKTFNVEDFWNYIEAKRDSNDKTIFEQSTLDDANEAIAILKTHDKTNHLFKLNKGLEEINQLKLKVSINGKDVKIMMDKVIIDHNTKTIYPYDLKCTDMRQRSFPYLFKKMKYYLQASLYSAAIIAWAKELYSDYVVSEFRFIVYSRLDKYPFIWKVSDAWLNQGFYGFIDYRQEQIKGVLQLLEDYYYYRNNEIYEIERDILESNEIMIV